MLRSMLCLGRDKNGYPTDGIDIVPEPREPLNELITSLEQINKQVTKLKLRYWQECYEMALKELSKCDYTLSQQ